MHRSAGWCDDFVDIQALGNFVPGGSGGLTVFLGPGRALTTPNEFATGKLSDVQIAEVRRTDSV